MRCSCSHMPRRKALRIVYNAVFGRGGVRVEQAGQQDSRREEHNVRHDVVVFLTLYSLIGLDVLSVKDKEQREKAKAAWVTWGIVATLIGSFVLAPARDAQQKALSR